MLGDKINKNLEAWISIGKKLSSLIEKCKPTRISEDAAICWVINELSSQDVPLQDLDIRLQVVQFSKGPRKSNLKLEATQIVYTSLWYRRVPKYLCTVSSRI